MLNDGPSSSCPSNEIAPCHINIWQSFERLNKNILFLVQKGSYMPSVAIESLMRSLNASILTDVFLILLLAIFVLSIYWKRKHIHSQFTSYAPTLLTSIGILGTFAGIISGLLDFDTADIDKSIGPLLEGLKTAFISSLVGMLLSILYKGIVTTGFLIPKQVEVIDEDSIDSTDFYSVMKQQVESINQLKNAIAGEEDSSLVSLVKLQRSDSNDFHKAQNEHMKALTESISGISDMTSEQKVEFKEFQDRLWRSLQDFADMLSKSATEQVIEALKQVIQDFNNNLIEQFGSNFEQLNLAVIKLVDWQENYKHQLIEMEKQYAQGVEAIAATEASVANISEEAKVIPSTMNELKTVVEINQHQINELDRHLEAFKDVRDKAVEAVPEIRGQIDQAIEGAKQANDELAKGILESAEKIQSVVSVGAENYELTVDRTRGALEEAAQATANSSEEIKEQFSATIEEINNNMRNLIVELQDGGKELTKSYQSASKELIDGTSDVQSAFTQGIEQIQQSLVSTIEEQASEHRKQADKVFSGLESSIENALANTGESLERQVDVMDKTMGQEIEKVMQSMGNALASISGQFTEDYQQLVDKMHQVTKAS